MDRVLKIKLSQDDIRSLPIEAVKRILEKLPEEK